MPSAFQKTGAASTRPQQPGNRAEADRDLVDLVGSPPSSATIAVRKAGSDGSPETPTVRPSRSRGRSTGARAARAASGLSTKRGDGDDVRTLGAGDREVVDVEDPELRAPRRRA